MAGFTNVYQFPTKFGLQQVYDEGSQQYSSEKFDTKN